jgi:hypothetical protein
LNPSDSPWPQNSILQFFFCLPSAHHASDLSSISNPLPTYAFPFPPLSPQDTYLKVEVGRNRVILDYLSVLMYKYTKRNPVGTRFPIEEVRSNMTPTVISKTSYSGRSTNKISTMFYSTTSVWKRIE